MKVLIQWEMPIDKREEIYTTFASTPLSEYQEQWNDGMKTLGRWHDPATGFALAVVETTDMKHVTRMMMKWSHLVNSEVSVVYDDAETHAICSESMTSG